MPKVALKLKENLRKSGWSHLPQKRPRNVSKWQKMVPRRNLQIRAQNLMSTRDLPHKVQTARLALPPCTLLIKIMRDLSPYV